MENKVALQSDFIAPELFDESKSVLLFSKKSPFKDTCNEDALGVFKINGSFVLAVADGAGGHPKGEQAAELVLTNLKKALAKSSQPQDSVRTRIIDAIEETNRSLLQSGVGAKTTVTVCEISDNRARGYQVGDSTLVICGQKGKLKYRSTSHSPVGYGVEAGLIDEKDALNHPDLHYISNLVGESGMKIEIGPEIDLKPNDSVFLASDGIFDNVQPEEIVEIVRKGGIEEISKALMDLIKKKIYDQDDSKKDDISFILLKK